MRAAARTSNVTPASTLPSFSTPNNLGGCVRWTIQRAASSSTQALRGAGCRGILDMSTVSAAYPFVAIPRVSMLSSSKTALLVITSTWRGSAMCASLTSDVYASACVAYSASRPLASSTVSVSASPLE